MRFCFLVIAALTCSAAKAQEQPSSWMLLLRTDTGATFAPTTYETSHECEMLAERIKQRTADRVDCLPAHYAKDDVARYVAANEEQESRQAEIAKQRPALEAERKEILSDRIKRNTLKYIYRLREIESMIGPPPNP